MEGLAFITIGVSEGASRAPYAMQNSSILDSTSCYRTYPQDLNAGREENCSAGGGG